MIGGLTLVMVATLPFAVAGASLPDPVLALALVARDVEPAAERGSPVRESQEPVTLRIGAARGRRAIHRG